MEAAAGGKGAQALALEDLFTAMATSIKEEEYEKVVKTAGQILKASPRDQDALLCKVVAFIQLDRTGDALSAIAAAKTAGLDLPLHKAYCLYRKNRFQEALDVIRSWKCVDGVDGGDKTAAAAAQQLQLGMLQLEGQILFRMGDNAACITKYEELMQRSKLSGSSLSSIDLKTNIVAAYVAAGRSNEVPKLIETLKVAPKDSFDLAFNVACAAIDRGDYAGAEAMLLLALRVGRETFIEDELNDEEIDEELAPVSVQLAYVQQCQGRVTEAMEGYSALLKRKFADPPSMAVASNNLIALRGPRELFDSLKKSDKILEKTPDKKLRFTEGLESKLPPRQKEAISFNKVLLLLHSNKLDQARELLSSVTEAFPSSFTPALLDASLLIKENKLEDVEGVLAAYAEKNPVNADAVNLVRAQVNVVTGNYQKAAAVLAAIESMKHKLGMTATLVALKERAGDIDGAEVVLDSALKWWSSLKGDNKSVVEAITHAAASFKLSHGRHKAAAVLFEQLLKSKSPSIRASAVHGLVVSTAHFDPEAAEKFAAQLPLPPLPGLSSVDVSALERTVSAAGNLAAVRREKKTAAADGLSTDASGQKRGVADGENAMEKKIKKKTKKKKKPLYPKGFDPANPGPPPDPERWLPKRERSSFKSKRKHKNMPAMKGSQGAAPSMAAAAEERDKEKEKQKISTTAGVAAADGAAAKSTAANANALAAGAATARNRRKKSGKR